MGIIEYLTKALALDQSLVLRMKVLKDMGTTVTEISPALLEILGKNHIFQHLSLAQCAHYRDYPVAVWSVSDLFIVGFNTTLARN